MLTPTVDGDSRLSLWLRVREFAVPPSMIETATARRHAGDWAGACAAAGFEADLDLRSVARTHGRHLAARIRADLRHLAPDLLRWHMPRIAPHGLLRPGLTVALARYEAGEAGGAPPLHLVARTPPAWADAGQRISLALWDGSRSGLGAGPYHPHPRPGGRFRLDLHRHLWDARRTGELRIRSGAGLPPAEGAFGPPEQEHEQEHGARAVGRWAAEAGILLHAGGHDTRTGTATVGVRLGARNRLVLDLVADGRERPGPLSAWRIAAVREDPGDRTRPVLPDAATWIPPDLELIRSGAIDPGRLHPLVAPALLPGHASPAALPAQDPAGRPHLVDCRGTPHRIGLVDGVLAPLDHDPAEIRREELLAALTGTPLPCLQVIDQAHREPDCLTGVRERLHHGDITGALAVVEGLLGPGALLRDGALREALERAARRRILYGLFRAGLAEPGPDRVRPGLPRPRRHRSHPRHTTGR
ncbi:hypothetical protein OOK31_16585 [Streptomyces sp. NBC_00249]|uniref:hypothetical protein n=1 Tax=Streptomyces sp. NBC_00249 TaxID=2975690 RepID=UPI0022519F58|nr:hypothetical protein [Streptomyces sp. NBC_00249]MCX5195502.1 hypothetical protein [Streptomyces sp. NBC_00249]